MIKIYIEGAESTGKTQLSEQLADFFDADFLPEYGRLYLETHWGKFGYNDIENIAQTQLQLEKSYENNQSKLLFIDVSLINTRQWFIEKYAKYPLWIDTQLKKYKNNFFLFCNTDIEWQADRVRSNSGKFREILQQKYRQTLLDFNIPFFEINGLNKKRFLNAQIAVQNYLKKIKEFS